MRIKRRTGCVRSGQVVFGLVLPLCILVGAQTFAAQQARAGYASIIVDAETGEVLRSRNADTRNYPASLTKLMTLYLLFEAVEEGRLGLDTKLKVSKRSARQPPSRLGLRAGSTIRVREAISALVVKSANDVAVVVAEALGGTERRFGALMTRKARALGMSRTTFRNASGLPNRAQRSTARDMARLARAVLQTFPHRYHYFDDKRFRYSGTLHHTHNRLIGNYRGLDGMKTGYIRASGFNLVASAKRNGRRIIAVVLGGKTSRSRNAHMVKLLDMGFERLAVRHAKRGRTHLADIPRPAFKSDSAAPGPRFKPATVKLARAPNAAKTVAIPKPVKTAGVTVAAAPAGRAAGRRWGIQVGAYASVTAAEIAIRRATVRSRLLNGVAPTLARQGALYRVRFIGLYRNDADQACQAVRTATMPCVVIHTPELAADLGARARS